MIMITIEQVKLLNKWDGTAEHFKGKRFENSLGRKIIGYYDRSNKLHIVVESDDQEFQRVEREGISVDYQVKDLKKGEKLKGLDFICRSVGFDEYFVKIINEIIRKSETDGQFEKNVLSVIENWYHFLELPLINKLSFQNLLGLYGEIASMRDLIDEGADAEEVLQAWRGPDGSKKDIIGQKVSVEVKASAREEGHVHQINGLDQLEGYRERNLHVYSWSISIVNDGTGEDICSLIQQMEKEYFRTPTTQKFFHDKLYQAKYDKRDEDQYSDTFFKIRDRFLCKVDDEFPVITNDSFKSTPSDRIRRVEYNIDLNGYHRVPLKEIVHEI